MREHIEAKINEWQQGLEQLHAQRMKLAQQLTEVDAAIQRNLGAIAAGQELLAGMAEEPAEEKATP